MTIGRPLLTFDFTMVEPAKTTCVRDAVGVQDDDVGEQPVVELDGDPAGDLLALLGWRRSAPRRATRAGPATARTVALGATR